METDILAMLFDPLRVVFIGLVLVIFVYLFLLENKYDKALKTLKNDPDNHDLYLEVMRLGRAHMIYKRKQHIGQMTALHPDTPREELAEEAYRLYGDEQIKDDIYRVVGRTYR